MTTKLQRPFKRELDVNGEKYTLTLDPDGLKLVAKGRRKGIDHGAVTRTCPADLLHSPQPGLQRFAHWQAA